MGRGEMKGSSVMRDTRGIEHGVDEDAREGSLVMRDTRVIEIGVGEARKGSLDVGGVLGKSG